MNGSVKRAQKPVDDIIGLDIGAAVIKATLVRGEHVVLWGALPTPPGTIVGGEVADPELLAKALHQLWRQVGFDSHLVNLTVSNIHTQFSVISIVEPTQQRQQRLELVVKTMAETQFSPLPLDELNLDYRELTMRTTDSGGGTRLQLQLAAAERKMIDSYIDAFRRTRLQIVSCELGPLAAARAVIYPYHSAGAHLAIEIGAERTRLVVVNASDVLFLRSIEIGGNDFTAAVAGLLGIPFADAERVKRLVGLNPDLGNTELAAEAVSVAETMQETADRLIQGLLEARRAYELRPDARSLEGFSLLGGGSRLQGLGELLSLYLDIPGPAPIELRAGLAIAATDGVSYATALGAAVSQDMSLLPAAGSILPGRRSSQHSSRFNLRRAQGQIRKLKRRRSSSNGWMIGLLGAALIGGGCYFGAPMLKKQTPASAPTVLPAPAGPLYTGTGTDRNAQIAADLLTSERAAAHVSDLVALATASKLSGLEMNESHDQLRLSGQVTSPAAAVALQRKLGALSYATLLPTSTPPAVGGHISVSYTLIVKDGS